MRFALRRRMERKRRRTTGEASIQALVQLGWFALAAGCLVMFRSDKIAYTWQEHGTTLHSQREVDPMADFTERRLMNANASDCAFSDKLCYVGVCEPEGSDALVFPPHPLDALLLFYLFILFHTFIGIAIVCDEMFVPALEVIAERWELSNDVAGATLMAAGGSAPELSTSLIGTFRGSDVGFAAIVGSAVFNVLFVIAMCAIFTPQKFKPLELTWWPLARDCSYYILSLCMLALFFKGPWSPNEIELWEAILQFMLYIGYVTLMKYSERLEQWVKSKHVHQASHAIIQVAPMETDQEFFNPAPQPDPNADFKQPSLFRLGIMELMTRDCGLAQKFAVQCISGLEGDAVATFNTLDSNGDGFIYPDEMKKFLTSNTGGPAEPAEQVTDERVKLMVDEIDPDNTGKVDQDKFVVWYMRSTERVNGQVQEIFNKLDTNQSGTITRQALRKMLTDLGHDVGEKEIDKIESDVNLTAGEINLQDFNAWYMNSLFWTEKMEEGDEAANVKEMEMDEEEGPKGWDAIKQGFADLRDPKVSRISKFNFILTLPYALSISWVPDMGEEKNSHYAFFVFFFSIAYIGGLCVLMVESATVIGYMLCIPDVVMGLVFLAAGTSVPDLISSVIVAQEGHGDMAVSSSIGSNIFDVCVGLPVPWILFSLSMRCRVTVSASNLFSSLCILLVMVAFVVLSIRHYGWKMTNSLGGAMLVFYLLYLLQDMIIVFVSGDVSQDNDEC